MQRVREIFRKYQPQLISVSGRTQAVVAAVFRENTQTESAELLFIRRAELEGDPWSGHLAFPGGRVAVADSHPRHTVQRETLEELGLDLREASYLGRMDDLMGRPESPLRMVVSLLLYEMQADSDFQLNHEVEEAFWVPLSRLVDPQYQVLHEYPYRNRRISLPAIRLLDPPHPVLWGLTYRFIELILGHLGHEIPSTGWLREGKSSS